MGTRMQGLLETVLEAHENGAANLAFRALFDETPDSVDLDAGRIQAMAQAIGKFLVKNGIDKKAVAKWLQTVKERCDHIPHRSGSGSVMLSHERDIARGAFLESGVTPLGYQPRGVLDDRSLRKLMLKRGRLS